MTIAVIAGEASGDRLAAAYVTELRARRNDLEFIGVGGEELRGAGVEIIVPSAHLSVVGLTEVVRRYGALRTHFHRVLRTIHDRSVDLLVTVDFPGFNLRLARAARSAGVPVLHLVSPQIWAWRPWRVRAIRRSVDELIVLFPFEVDFYRMRGIEVHYFGHPVIERLATGAGEGTERSAADRPIVAWLPGSRDGEVRRHLPIIAEAIRLLSGDRYHHIVSRHPELQAELYEAILDGTSADLRTDAVSLLRQADCAMVKSGTSTIEAMALGVPFAVFYRASVLTAALARRLARVPFIAMPNIIAGTSVVRELLQAEMTGENLAEEVRRLTNPKVAGAMASELREVTASLIHPDRGAVARMVTFTLTRFIDSDSSSHHDDGGREAS